MNPESSSPHHPLQRGDTDEMTGEDIRRSLEPPAGVRPLSSSRMSDLLKCLVEEQNEVHTPENSETNPLRSGQPGLPDVE